MLFQSWQYLLLLIATVLFVSFVENKVIKRVAVLSFSIFFYAYGAAWQTVLFVLVILLAYFSGRILDRRKQKPVLIFSLTLLFLPLLLYKYVPFFLSLLPGNIAGSYKQIFVLPIGISFYTFQAVGYVIDVYRGKSRAERDLLSFACFVSFFPQLVAGPIERYDNLSEQIRNMPKPTYEMISRGFKHIVLGLCLKLLVAESMAPLVDPVYNNLGGKSGLAVIIATVCFGIQIYCDFNGYTQIAIGSAKVIGINLMQNFDHPYRAVSVADFWRRWHISLTTWFRDYLYIPLGGNRKGPFRTVLNSILTFLVSGIWHGANWTFALWGLANGTGMAVEKLYYKKLSQKKVLRAFYAVAVFVFVNLCWVFFRANSLQDAFLCYQLMFTQMLPPDMFPFSVSSVFNFLFRYNGWAVGDLLRAAVAVMIYLWYEYGKSKDLTSCLWSKKGYVRWITYAIVILVTLYFGRTLQQSDFVYFRF